MVCANRDMLISGRVNHRGGEFAKLFPPRHLATVERVSGENQLF